ncbi:Uncharacterised protein [Pasteurella multocida]|nr:Uncharacterised protein [Pasteurella multocida]
MLHISIFDCFLNEILIKRKKSAKYLSKKYGYLLFFDIKELSFYQLASCF